MESKKRLHKCLMLIHHIYSFSTTSHMFPHQEVSFRKSQSLRNWSWSILFLMNGGNEHRYESYKVNIKYLIGFLMQDVDSRSIMKDLHINM